MSNDFFFFLDGLSFIEHKNSCLILPTCDWNYFIYCYSVLEEAGSAEPEGNVGAEEPKEKKSSEV